MRMLDGLIKATRTRANSFPPRILAHGAIAAVALDGVACDLHRPDADPLLSRPGARLRRRQIAISHPLGESLGVTRHQALCPRRGAGRRVVSGCGSLETRAMGARAGSERGGTALRRAKVHGARKSDRARGQGFVAPQRRTFSRIRMPEAHAKSTAISAPAASPQTTSLVIHG